MKLFDVKSQLASSPKKEQDKPYSQVVVSSDVSKNYDITPEFNLKLKAALESRLDACWSYTRERIAKINENMESYQAQQSSETGDSISKTSLMMVRTWVEDWMDIYFNALNQVKDNISILDKQYKAKGEITRSFDIDPKALNKNGMLRILWDGLVKSGETEKFKADHEYRFDKKQAIKSVVESLIDKSGMYDQSTTVDGRNNLESLAYYMVISGMGAVVNCLEPINRTELEIAEGRAVVSQSTHFRFDVADPRSLIFPLAQKLPWFARIKTVQFSDLLSSATDDNGKQNQNSYYNLDRLNVLAQYIRDNCDYPTASSLTDSDNFESGYQSDIGIDEMSRIDEMTTVLEFHYVPVLFPGDKKATRSLVTAICMDKLDLTSGSSPSLFIIGARKTPFIYGIPIHFTNFAYDLKSNDPQGFGLPEIVCEMASRIQKTVSYISDLITRALKGIHFINADCIENMDSLENLQSRMFIPLKNTNGVPLSSIVQSWTPDIQAIQLGMNFLEMIKQSGKTIARSGMSGESIKSGNVTATEFASVKKEMDKQTERPIIRVAIMLEDWLLDMYRYSAMYNSDEIGIICKGKRYFDEIDDADNVMGANIGDIEFEHDKEIQLKVSEWFVNSIGFSIKSLTNEQGEAIAKQQAMEAINLLLGKGLVIDPQTGKPIVITDEDGKKMVIDIKGIISKALDSLGYDTVFIPAPEEAAPIGLPQGMPPAPGQPEQQGGGKPSSGVQLPSMAVNPQLGGNL